MTPRWQKAILKSGVIPEHIGRSVWVETQPLTHNGTVAYHPNWHISHFEPGAIMRTHLTSSDAVCILMPVSRLELTNKFADVVTLEDEDEWIKNPREL